MIVFAVGLGVGAIVAAGYALWLIALNPIAYLTLIGAVTHGIIFLFGLLIYLDERETTVSEVAGSGLSKAGNKAKETPGVRRVYGNCPVSLKTCPRWFESLQKRFD